MEGEPQVSETTVFTDPVNSHEPVKTPTETEMGSSMSTHQELEPPVVHRPQQQIVPKQGEVSSVGLTSYLTEISTEKVTQSSMFGDPKELGLERLDRDEYGFFLNISQELVNEIQSAQSSFIPVFLNVHGKYAQYEEWAYLNKEKPFVFSPTTIKIMSEQILPGLMKEVTELYSNGANINENPERSIHWEESDIQGILNKLLAYESYRLERIMAPRARDHMLTAFPNDPTIKVKELCTGAGITTALMYEALKETGKDIELHTVDNSLQSVMCAATLLTLRGIPTRIILEGEAEEKAFKGVTIYFESALQSMQKEGSYHFVFSDNGINYFEESQHFEVLKEMLKKVKPGGLFQDCTLDPSMQIDLSTPSMFKAIFSNKRTPRSGDAEYELKQQDGVLLIKQLFSPSSTMQYELLNDVRKKLGVKLFWEYLMGAKKAASITKKLAPKIAQDLRKTGAKVQELTGLTGTYYPGYDQQKNSLTRFFELKLPIKDVME